MSAVVPGHSWVGHTTVIEGDDIRTGVTAVIPAPGNLYMHPVPAWIHVGNGYGKLLGITQAQEFGELETPILLTCTLCVWTAADAMKERTYQQPGMGARLDHATAGLASADERLRLGYLPVGWHT